MKDMFESHPQILESIARGQFSSGRSAICQYRFPVLQNVYSPSFSNAYENINYETVEVTAEMLAQHCLRLASKVEQLESLNRNSKYREYEDSRAFAQKTERSEFSVCDDFECVKQLLKENAS